MGYVFGFSEENTGGCICPYCGSELTHVDFDTLVFMCPECGEYIEFAREGKVIETIGN